MVKKANTRVKGQKAITNFFTRNGSGGGGGEDVDSSDVEDTPLLQVNKTAPDASDLPPIHSIPAIFSDLVERIPKIKFVAEHVKGRKLRVATMCSGTESPLLALELMRKAIRDQHDVDLDIEHVFSCEIEPFKQAYIERNFSPPLLFRDVCELGEDEATTAYGAKAKVPGDVDILIAGTSCVDYSNLNNEKQDLEANGESGRTFRGMMSWVCRHRPPLVILENVCSAPWQRVQQQFEKRGYSASFLRVDTKNFYIPHTRTRVYLMAVNETGSGLPKEWDALIKKLKRPASSTLDAFLLPSDDPRIHQAREKLVRESYNALDRRTGRTDWGRCESRHQRARLDEELGSKRPLTNWDEGGFCKLPDFAWGDWGVGQVERVWDLMDISVLRAAKKGVDPSYKSQVWNLSQNVDRSTGSSRPGICPCLTPSMIPYITNRGGPMVGLEALSMQGLPVDKLLLTRETEDQLADLAGNAMSTTVVGACILAALVVGKRLLKHSDDLTVYGEAMKDETDETLPTAMEVDEPIDRVEDHISGETQLIEKPLDLSTTSARSLSDLLADADKSSRLCECEGRINMTDRQLNRCLDCGSSSCVKCGGRPEHNFVPMDLIANPRLSPSDFAKELKSTLPMCLSVSGVTKELLDSLKDSPDTTVSEKQWTIWRSAVLRATDMELRFVEPKRQEIWMATYESPNALLELLLHPQRPEWRFFAKPEDNEPANSEARKLLASPLGRMVCRGSLLEGSWEFALPHTESVQLQITGVGELVPSWEAKLGLVGKNYKDRTVHSKLEISVPDDKRILFDRDISGVYDLLDKCGTANNALHKKAQDGAEPSQPSLFLLMDPTRCGEQEEDCFVFSISKRRYEYGETRPVICKLDGKWRQSSEEGAEDVICHIPCKWIKSKDVELQPSRKEHARYAVPGDVFEIGVTANGCESANALLICHVPLGSDAGPEWPRGEWGEVDKVHERSTFKSLAWLTERTRNIAERFDAWQTVSLPDDHESSVCTRCAPTSPDLRWVKVGKKVLAIEDTIQAGAFERALKRRPAPFVTQLKLDEGAGIGTVRIGVNVSSLVHRALSRLPSTGRVEKPSLAWCLDTNFTPMVKLNLPKFSLSSNRHDPEHAQPPHFEKVKLRPEQLRSLDWMLKQESKSATPFVEEEIAEAVLEPLGWRAQGRAQRPVHIRGGVLADEVGYGKTAITLGLIDSAAQDVKAEFDKLGDVEGKIPVKATLVIVPPHLTRQWASEVNKFCPKKFKVVVISTATNLNSLTIDEVQDADIVIVAANLFHSSVYLANLEAFAAGGALPAQDGRYFNARLETTLSSLRHQVELLKTEGSARVMKEILEARRRDDEAAAQAVVQTKRLKGKSYRDAADAATTTEHITTHGDATTEIEVVIPALPRSVMDTYSSSSARSSAAGSSSEAPTEGEDEESDHPRPKRRTAKKTTLIISDDEDATTAVSEYEDDDEEEKPKRAAKRSKPARKGSLKKSGKKSQASSDYDDDSAAETQSEEESAEESDALKKAKPKGKGKGKATVSRSKGKLNAAMDVDEPSASEVKTSKAGRKRKSTGGDDDDRPAKKQKRREEGDPWKLMSTAVKEDWTEMQAPPLEMFHFARKVVDEYTYLDGKILSLVTNLTADRHWVLSGTPPIHDFGALKTIAAFLHLHLGVDDDAEGQSAQVKKRRREQTAVEKFHSFREVRSLEWHAHRHELGQKFLDQFVRQNIAEVDEIPSTEKIEKIILPAAERAIYLELEHHLRALEMTIKRGKKTESDREKRLAKSLGDSSSAEEALLKRCSHFDLDITEEENAMRACEVIVQERTKQLDECKVDLLSKLSEALKMQKKIGRTGMESMFQEYVRVSRSEGVGDKEATEAVLALLDEAGVDNAENKIKNNKGKGDVELSNSTKDLIWEHREQTHDIRRITKELVGRVRSLRYFTVVRDLQRQSETPPVVACPGCERQKLPIEEVAVLSSCGHMGCLECVKSCAEREECVYAASGTCSAAARVLNVVKGETLGVDDAERDGRGKHFGMKLEKVIELMKKTIPTEERILVFVQFPDLMKKVAEALSANKIKFLEIKGTATQKSKNLETFQNNTAGERVLLLNVMDESASGANLTGSNHAIFLSPLLAPSQEVYNACETQAIGRLRRYGQTKLVHVWRFLTTDTIDVEIFRQRTGKVVE